MTLIQIFLYLAWIKVAEELLNPLGDDDDDFECNYVIDYNITHAIEMTGTLNGVIPEQIKDKFKKPSGPQKGYKGSVSNVKQKVDEHIHMIPHYDFRLQNTLDELQPAGKIVMKRRLTFPLSFRRRNENQRQSDIPGGTLARQSTIQTINAEDYYKTSPTRSSNDETVFSETYSFYPNQSSKSSDEMSTLPFAKSGRFTEKFTTIKE